MRSVYKIAAIELVDEIKGFLQNRLFCKRKP